MGRFNVTNYYRGKYIDNKTKCHYEERSDVVISSNNAIATPSARNDNKFARHSELTRKLVELAKRDFLFLLGDSESINANKTLTPTLSQGEGAKNEITQNDNGRKILKQLTPEQCAAYGGGKYMNTSRTAKSGSLRQY